MSDKCADCGHLITPAQAKTTKGLWGRELCNDCHQKETEKGNAEADKFDTPELKCRRRLQKEGFEESKKFPGLWKKDDRFVDLAKNPIQVGVISGVERHASGHGVLWLEDLERDLNGYLKFTGAGKKNDKKETVPASMNNTEVLPDGFVLSEKLLQSMPFEKVMLEFQNTKTQFIRHRPGRGNQDLAFVEGWYMKQVINLATKWKWSSKIDGWKETPTEIICWGTVTITLPDGSQASQSGVGSAEIKRRKGTNDPVSIGDDYKSAMTDMEKKAISKWGIAGDVYRGDV